MKWLTVVVAVFLFTASQTVLAEPKVVGTAKNDKGTVIVLLDEPCVDEEVLRWVTPESKPMLKNTHSKYEGQDYGACWAEPEEGTIFIVWSDGNPWMGPKDLFEAPKQ